MLGFKIYKIRGQSMFPAFADQDFVLATHYWRKLLPGDVVVVNHPQY